MVSESNPVKLLFLLTAAMDSFKNSSSLNRFSVVSYTFNISLVHCETFEYALMKDYISKFFPSCFYFPKKYRLTVEWIIWPLILLQHPFYYSNSPLLSMDSQFLLLFIKIFHMNRSLVISLDLYFLYTDCSISDNSFWGFFL